MKKVLLLLLIVPTFTKAQYKFYYNDRFEVSIKYPSTFKEGIAPGNNDGRSFFSQDKKCKISCAGSYFDSDNNLNAEFKIYSTGIAVKYKMIKDNFFAFSGYDSDGNIYYQKSIFKKLDFDGSSVIKSVWIIYPQNQKGKYDDVCKIVAASLK